MRVSDRLILCGVLATAAAWHSVSALAAPSATLENTLRGTSESYFTLPHWEAVVGTALIVMLCVILHYETFNGLTLLLPKLRTRRRPRVLILIFSILGLHILEIWIFGLGYFWLLQSPALGALHGVPVHGLPDYVYFSAVVYNTLGFGDIVPVGPIRFLTGTEAMTGLVLITWSASFTFLEMQRFWKPK